MPPVADAAGYEIDVDLVIEAGVWPDAAVSTALATSAAAAVAEHDDIIDQNVSVCIALSDDATVAALNAQFRGKAKPTNVLSFPPGPAAEANFLGDIILASETVAGEAAQLGVPLAHHIQHLIVHGILHLAGFDHENDAEAEEMEQLEIEILGKLGIANPYSDGLQFSDKEKTGIAPGKVPS